MKTRKIGNVTFKQREFGNKMNIVSDLIIREDGKRERKLNRAGWISTDESANTFHLNDIPATYQSAVIDWLLDNGCNFDFMGVKLTATDEVIIEIGEKYITIKSV